MLEFKKTELNEITEYRNAYFASIYESQELYIEWLVRKSDCFLIANGEVTGYFISFQNILVEFHLVSSYIKDCNRIFKKVITDFNIAKVYCKSFDPLLMKCCMKNSVSHQVKGTLFRDFIKTETDDMTEFLIKRPTDADIPYLLVQKDELYESEEELRQMVRDNNMYLYYLDDQLMGCGFIIKVLDEQNYYDIGMWVKTEYRNQGFATRIIANMKGCCLKNNWLPICGCAADNVASRKTLEKNGFFSKHDLIEFYV